MTKRKVSTTDEWIDATIKHLGKVEADEQYEFVHQMIYNLALHGGYSVYEMLGILEAVKYDLISDFNDMANSNDDDE